MMSIKIRSGPWLEKAVIALFALIILVYILIPSGKEETDSLDRYTRTGAGAAVPTTPDGKAQRQRLIQEAEQREENLKRMQDQLLTDPCPGSGSTTGSILEHLDRQAVTTDLSLTDELLPEKEPPEPPAALLKEPEAKSKRFSFKPPTPSPSPLPTSHYQNSPFIFFKDEKPPEPELPVLYEGSFIEAVVQHRLVVDNQESPIIARTTQDVYAHDSRLLLIPRGSCIIGKAQVVSDRNQSRLHTLFHRFILPNGKSINFDKEAKGMDRSGSFGISSKVNRHTLKKYSAALFMGVLDGLGALSQNRIDQLSPWSPVLSDTERNLREARSDVLRRDLEIKPTVTIKPGTRIKIYLCQDVRLSPYQEQER
jgi:type IV secretory pathway VirB10-like protein